MHRSLQFAVGLGSLFVLLSGCGSSTASDPFAVGSTATATAGGTAGTATGTVIPTSGGATATTTAGTGAATAAGTAGGDASMMCGVTNVGAQGGAANLLLVIDRSGSMGDTPTGFTTTKWVALQSALPAALNMAASGLSLGLEYFPSMSGGGGGGGGSCTVAMGNAAVSIAVGPPATTLMPINMSIARTMPGGSTPTAAALQAALAYYTTGGGMALTGPKYVLLATDGAPNCNSMLTCPNMAPQCTNIQNGGGGGNCAANGCLDDVATVGAITALASAGIKTYVVGIPGAEAYANVLDAMADAGQVPAVGATHRFYEVTAAGGAAGLTSVLSTVVGSVKITSCDLALDRAAAPGFTLAVYVDGMLTTINTDWILDESTNPPTVRLQGTTCQNVMTNGANSVQIQIFCPGQVPPPRVN